MLRTFLLLTLFATGLTLSAATTVDGPTLRSHIDGHTITLLFCNLERKSAHFSLTQADDPEVSLFENHIAKHNGFRKCLDLAELTNGRYVLTVKHEGQTYYQVLRVNDQSLWVSQWTS